MPDLTKSLQSQDIGFLRIVAELWGVGLSQGDARAALPVLVLALHEQALVSEVVEALPAAARQALDNLYHSGGRMPWALFTRRYGSLREFGPGKRDREKPHLAPVSAAEMLWYRALIGRAFFDTPAGPEEFAFIPDDLAALLPAPVLVVQETLGRPASPVERAYRLFATDRLLDHATTLLAALRLGLPPDQVRLFSPAWQEPAFPLTPPPLTLETVRAFLSAAGLLDAAGIPLPEPTKAFLEAPRGEALAMLARAWLDSAQFNDLRLVPTLRAEGEWENDPRRARQAVIDFIASVMDAERKGDHHFWSLGAFVQAVHQHHPDFQRPAGDYDSWFLCQADSGEFLRGFAHWEAVDGALIRYLVAGPLYWLGICDLVLTAPPGEAGARLGGFRFSAWAGTLLAGGAPQGLAVEEAQVHIGSDFRVSLPGLAPRALRYQLARFCEWDEEKADGYHYHLTPASLARARQQGLTTSHLLTLLRRQARTVPPSLVRAVERWERKGCEARLEPMVVLRLASPELLQELRASRAARFLGDPLGPTAIPVRAGAVQKVLRILAEMGYLAEIAEDLPK
ncbi:MAG: helicase-associated domain-containing protein [Anaerolineales bacterium]|jgi:hypothetical protein|nr:helicase-associated domain-containing protein [Anaerolineales bacterium]